MRVGSDQMLEASLEREHHPAHVSSILAGGAVQFRVVKFIAEHTVRLQGGHRLALYMMTVR